MADKIDFSEALIALKDGKKVQREGWHGKGMHLKMQTPDENSKMTLSYIYINIPCQNCTEAGEETHSVNLVPWSASQTDLLAEDYQVVE